ncbi:MAG: RagB/SusD family nutrient uptake outer membrane protein [Lutibacter sp.]|nr:RagB/SusD family nutrient uptake outer membrane protein [Lutibacter sp.]
MNFTKPTQLFALISMLFSAGCSDYLDIVPDKTQEIDLLFERKEAAYKALATCYHFLPSQDAIYGSYVLASDEVATPIAHDPGGIQLMRGMQSASNPIMGYWSGFSANGQGQESLWKGIRNCNTLIENIDGVLDMETAEKEQWKAEVQVLKAQFHFLLMRLYGPIPIVDENLPISAGEEAVRVSRKSIDDCFDYLINTIDNALPNLPVRVMSNNDLGRIDQVIAVALKSRILLYAASPLFNGNTDYDGFSDAGGANFFNSTADPEKWKKALEASQAAIELALSSGLALYNYNDVPAAFDNEAFQFSEVRSLYNYRYMFTDKWNSELIWGHSNPVTNWWQLQAPALMKKPNASSVEAAWQWLSPTLRMAELYYTHNGLPIEEDLSFNYQQRFQLVSIPAADKQHAQVGEKTVRLHLQREPRFYASIGFDRGINRTWGEKWNLQMRRGETHGRKANTNDYLVTGYDLKKICHPDSQGDGYNKIISYAWPMIRMAELYLNYAEAYNEYHGPSQEVFDALNLIRERSGIRHVEAAWSDASLAKTPNKHLDKQGLKEIIQQERMIELAFEGHRYHDIRRWKMAEDYFNSPVKGWRVNEVDANDYYQVDEVGQRTFNIPRDYFHPIKISELTVNTNLVQNPGW